MSGAQPLPGQGTLPAWLATLWACPPARGGRGCWGGDIPLCLTWDSSKSSASTCRDRSHQLSPTPTGPGRQGTHKWQLLGGRPTGAWPHLPGPPGLHWGFLRGVLPISAGYTRAGAPEAHTRRALSPESPSPPPPRATGGLQECGDSRPGLPARWPPYLGPWP